MEVTERTGQAPGESSITDESKVEVTQNGLGISEGDILGKTISSIFVGGAMMENAESSRKDEGSAE